MALPGWHCAIRTLSVRMNIQPLKPRPLSTRFNSSPAVADSVAHYSNCTSLPVCDRNRPHQHGAWLDESRWLVGCLPQSAPLRVAVLLSGGVDSSLALALLKAAGHEVHAFYLQIWFQEDFRNFWDSCPWEEDLDYAKKVCDQLDVRLTTVPLTKQYWDRVVSHCVEQIHSGRTPNPDVLCNSRVKFGAFLEYLHHHPSQFDRVASGHYACVEPRVYNQSSSSQSAEVMKLLSSHSHHFATESMTTDAQEKPTRVQLKLTPDTWKDQTYFLANLSQQQLQRVLFPLGHLTKKTVRELASAAQLPTMARKDSQGICFLGKVKFSEFIKEHLGEWPGPVIEAETNKVVAMHPGFWFYTIGQRSGLALGHLDNGPWYVVRKDAHMNAVYVSLDYYSDDKSRDSFTCGSFNWITGSPPAAVSSPRGHPPTSSQPCVEHGEPLVIQQHAASDENADQDRSQRLPDADDTLYVKVRHGPNMYECKEFRLLQGGSKAHVQLSADDQGLAAGQYAVFYRCGECLGCGVIE